MTSEFAYGTVEGTGSAINVSIGFSPDYVKCINIDDAGGKSPSMEWIRGMASGDGLKGLEIVDSGSTGDSSQELVTSNGIDPYDGTDAGNTKGFTIGADADLNASGETILWIAMRGGAGQQGAQP